MNLTKVALCRITEVSQNSAILCQQTSTETQSSVHLIFHSLTDGGNFPQVNRLGLQADQLPTPGFEVKNTWSCNRTALIFSWLKIKSTKGQFYINVDKKNQLDVTFVFFISLLLVAQYVSGNNVPIIRS